MRGGELAPDPGAEHGPHVRQVDYQRCQPARVETEAHQVGGRSQQVGEDVCEERIDGPVGHDHVPAAVDDDRRERLVRADHRCHGAVRRGQLLIVERALREARGEARGEQEAVAVEQRDVEVARGPQDHRCARVGPGSGDTTWAYPALKCA